MKLVKNDGSVISYSRSGLKAFLKDKIAIAKNYIVKKVKGCFRWIHDKLTVAENWVLKKIDLLGKKAEAYLDSRLGDDSVEVDDPVHEVLSSAGLV